MNKLNIGILGCADIARRLVIPALKSLPEIFNIVAIASRSEEKVNEFSGEFNILPVIGYDNLIDREDIDAVYMPLPTGLHEEYISKCLIAGKHVFVEKSFAMNHESAKKMVEFARAKGLLLMEDFMFKYHSQHNFTWQLIHSGYLGEIRMFRSQFGFPPLSKDNFRYDKASGGGALMDAGAYTLKAAQWFLGDKLEIESARLYIDEVKGVDIFGNISLMSDKGVSAQLSFGFDNYYQCNYEFWGSKGKLFAEKAFTPKPGEIPVINYERHGEKLQAKLDSDNHFVNILKEFHRSIEHGDHVKHLNEIMNQSNLLSQVQTKAQMSYL